MKLQSDLRDGPTDPVTSVEMDSESSGVMLDAQCHEGSRVPLTASLVPSPGVTQRAHVLTSAAGGDSGDEDEEGVGPRKPRGCRAILQESDSDGEEAPSADYPNADAASGSDEDTRGEESDRQRPRRIRVALDSADESGTEENGAEGGFALRSPGAPSGVGEEERQELSSPESLTNDGTREKPKGRKPGLDPAASDRGRERERRQLPSEGEDSDEDDLFTHKFGMGGDLGELGSDEEEEESLEAIKSSMKKKAQKSRAVSGAHQDDDDEEEAFLKKSKQNKGRVERKAAKAGRAAIQQLHSESQRIIRESNMSLPYHLPEPRSVHDFFKRRQLPAGDAMSLLKSTKYQADLLSGQGVPQSSTTQQSALAPEDACDLQAGSSAAAQGGVVGETGAADAAVTCQRLLSEGDGAEMTRESERTAGRSGDGDDDGRESTAPPAPGSEEHPDEEGGLLDGAEKASGTTSPEGRTEAPDGKDRPSPEPAQPCDDRQTVFHEATAMDAPKVSAAPELANAPRSPQSRVRARLLRLQGLGVDLSVRPTLLRAAAGTFIDLEEPTPNQGLNDLKERFLKHATRKSPMRPRGPVEIRVTRKETGADGKQQLLQEVLTVTVGDALEKPGAKLLSLKARLQEAMRLRRLEERQKRLEAYELDNEEGFQEEEEDGDEELTDEESDADSGGPDDEGPDEDDDEEEDETSPAKDEKCKAAHLGMSEATMVLFDHSTDTRPERSAGRACTPVQLKHNSDDELCADEGSSSRPSLQKDESHNSSFELLASSIPPYQPPLSRSRTPSVPVQRTPSPFSPMSQFAPAHFSGYSALSTGKLSETSLRMEDSEDLYQPSPERPGSPTSLPTDSEFRFSLGEESQSQLLDADGYLNVGRSKAHKIVSSKRKLNLLSLEENAMHSDMDELVGMCSGKFEPKNPTPRKRNSSEMDELVGLCSGKFESQHSTARQRKNSDMDELVGLCSGKFESQDPRPRKNSDMDELVGLCSGKFESQDPRPRKNSDMDELVGLCSGKFESQNPRPRKNSDKDDLVGLCSGKFESQDPTPRNTSDMDELVGLCSGKFESQVPTPKARINSDMDELLGLCSGNFESQDPIAGAESQDRRGNRAMAQRVGDRSTQARPDHIGEDEDKGVFDVLTDDEALSEEENKDEQDGSDAESGDEEEDKEEEEEEEEVKEEGEDEGDDVMSVAAKYKDGHGPIRKRARSHFVEEEAELSGSEAGSDEDFSGNEEDNEYEEEDIQEELPSDDELQDQVKRLHMKALLDEDKRQLRLYQEVLLPDGDLHSDGPGRRRTFRWKNLDDSSQVDLFPRDEGDAEGGEHELEEHEGEDQEVQRRKERFEREKWIREKGRESADEDDVGEDSQFLKLAKKITAKSLQKRSGPLPTARTAEGSVAENETPLQSKPARVPVRLGPHYGLAQVKSGSFLNKPRELLAKLASMSDPNQSAVRGASRNFVFHALSPGAGRGSATKPQERKPQVRRSLMDPGSQPSPKRARTASKQPGPKQPPRSVFCYLND
ncbi:claspin [Lampetra fluviatilis]